MKSLARTLVLVLAPMTLMAQTLPGGFKAAYVEGNVVGSDTGKPLTGAKIDVIGAKVKQSSLKASDACGTGFALSANNGNFAVGVGLSNMCVSEKHPFNGNYYVSVSKRGYLPSVQRIDFGSHNTNVVGGLVFRLTPAHAAIQGHVLWGGKGVPYAYAWVMPDVFAMAGHAPKGHVKGSLISESPMVRTDAHGKFQISVSPGSYVVMASKPGYQLITKTVNPAEQQMAQKMQAMLAKMPPQYRGNGSGSSLQALGGPQLGDYVTVTTGQTAVANLALAKASPPPVFHPAAMKIPPFTPYEMVLAGQARFSPNNVVFFTPMHPDMNSAAGHVIVTIVRSRVLLGGGKIDPIKDHIKVFNSAVYGMASEAGCQYRPGHIGNHYCTPGAPIQSFTDPTAQKGVAYYYYIFETRPYYVGSGGTIDFTKIGTPRSNALSLLTHY